MSILLKNTSRSVIKALSVGAIVAAGMLSVPAFAQSGATPDIWAPKPGAVWTQPRSNSVEKQYFTTNQLQAPVEYPSAIGEHRPSSSH